jgi:hypothetical protein
MLQLVWWRMLTEPPDAASQRCRNCRGGIDMRSPALALIFVVFLAGLSHAADKSVASAEWLLTSETVNAQSSRFEFIVASSSRPFAETPDNKFTRLVALPADARTVTVHFPGQDPYDVEESKLLRARGRVLVPIECSTPPPGTQQMVFEVIHDGNWDDTSSRASRYSRGYDRALASTALGIPPNQISTQHGSYVILTSPDLFDTAQPLAEWKHQKGFPVVLATTDETGTSFSSIRSWLQSAYNNWEIPPEYLLLLGDVDRIPTGYFSGNPSDHMYALLDGEDWLPDLMVGRLSVENSFEAETVVSKTVDYERNPYTSGGVGWCTRMLKVAGNYGSTTPTSTVDFCGEQMESIGFEPPAQVYFPPFWNGDVEITQAIDQGVSLVVYRGWAYGALGWEPPHFTVNEIPGLSNGEMLPVVMSFVCLTGDIGYSAPCFGEVWLRSGSPTEPKGAIAFIGNGEHWVHTRFNDAMAISFFERIAEPQITDLGTLMTAGKLRFMEYFPHQLDYNTHGEESVEFYFYIYLLLGDPELNFHKTQISQLDVAHPIDLPQGSNFVTVQTSTSDGLVPIENSRVALVQGDELLGCAFSDENGKAIVPLAPFSAGGNLLLTVTHPAGIPYQSPITTSLAPFFLTYSSHEVDDDSSPPSQGNGDGLINPGELVELAVTIANQGTSTASSVSAQLTCDDPVDIPVASTTYPDIPAGGQANSDTPFAVFFPSSLNDGTAIDLLLLVEHNATSVDSSRFTLTVSAPTLTTQRVLATDYLGNIDAPEPGEHVDLYLTLRNDGSTSTTGFSAHATINTSGGTVTDAWAEFGGVAPGDTVANTADPFGLQLAPDVPVGTTLGFSLTATTSEGYQLQASFDLVVGLADIHAVSGPDQYGYYAIDSGDIYYPDQVPEFTWQEISTAFGGPGENLEFQNDNYDIRIVELPFPFQYYGVLFESIRVSDNGWISFDTSDTYNFYNWPIPSAHGNSAIVAPFWDNLDPTAGDGVYTFYDAAEHTFIVEWSRLPHYREEITDEKTFQVLLYDPTYYPTSTGDGQILFQYLEIEDNDYLRNYSTIGIEAPSESDGLQYRYANIGTLGGAPPTPGFAILLTTETPAYFPVAIGDDALPKVVRLLGNAPNPFNPHTRMIFELPTAMPVSLAVYDPSGRHVRSLLASQTRSAGRNEVVWDGRLDSGYVAATGVYFYRLEAGGQRFTGKMMLLK